jgi:hypothetical protein
VAPPRDPAPPVNGTGGDRPAPPRGIAPAPRTAPLRAPSAQATVPPRTASGAARARSGVAPGRADGRSRRTVLAVLAGVAGVAIVAAVLAFVFLGGNNDHAPASKPNTVAPPAAATTTAGATGGGSGGNSSASTRVNRGQVTVAVLNGTTFTGLARSASDKLTKAGFKPGVVTNDTTNQTRSATAIFYAGGQRRAALEVARLIGIGRDAVQPLDTNTRTIAGSADVVVSVGADQAR